MAKHEQIDIHLIRLITKTYDPQVDYDVFKRLFRRTWLKSMYLNIYVIDIVKEEIYVIQA